ncbi:MAG: nucleotide sugar dehydrogenase [Rhodospirillales bacterium]|nr:nucleotide sugar dehydrogenase [Rhodospirillales bacterium]
MADMDIAVIGLGKLGSPLAAVLASRGHRVVGVDLNPSAVAAMNAGRAPVAEPGLQACIEAAAGRLRATTDFAELAGTDLSFVIVPTPSGPDGRFSNRFVLDAVRRVGEALRCGGRYHVVNITSTVMPGSTGGEIRAALEAASGRVVGRDIGLTYNPEFIALGSVVRDLLRPDMLLIGQSDARAGDVLEAAYRGVVEGDPPVQRMGWIDAEITKIAVNTFVTTKISYANMLSEMCERLPGADVDVVTAALGRDSRIGPKYLRAALGYGGPCFPRDNVALASLARGLGVAADIAVATDAINRRQVDRVVALVQRLAGGPVTVAVLGMAYKPDTPVVDESQGVLIARALAVAGHAVLIADPVALAGAAAVLGEAVTPFGDAAAAVAAAEIVVVTTPDPVFAALNPGCFAAGGTRRVVVDCWRVLPTAVGNVADMVHPGRGEPAHPR